jgi:4-hydroxymandelate oxidase
VIAPLPPLARIPSQIAALADYEPFARERMTEAVWAWLAGGAADECTLRENRAAFERLRLQGRVLADLAGGDTRLELFGQTLEHPILLAPVAYQKLVHPEGELATVLGAAALRAAMVVGTHASVSLEDIARAAQTTLWFQLYVLPDRGFTRELVQRAEAAGYRALVVTVDAPVGGVRNREQRAGFALPAGIEAVNLHGMAPLAPQVAQPGGAALFGSALLAAAPTWKDLEWLCSLTRLPVLVKGVMVAADAERAIASGAAGIVVSNHGGRVLDMQPATIDALPAIAAAVDGRVPVLIDGGIRRGTDVIEALALGARAVLVGRPFMYALAAAGAPGVAHVLHLLRTELEMAMVLTGCATLAAIDRSVIR